MNINVVISLVLAMVFGRVLADNKCDSYKEGRLQSFGFLREKFKLHMQIDHQQPVKIPSNA